MELVLIEGRFFIKIPTVKGDTIVAFCDTGGGYTAIYKPTVNKLGLDSKVKYVIIDRDRTNHIAATDIYKNRGIPYPQIQNYFKEYISEPFFEVSNIKEAIFLSKLSNYDVFLGQFFFINDAWTFNYKTGKLSINTPIPKKSMDENTQSIGFKKDKKGNKRFGHPSMKLKIDGKVIDFLFDTGATLILSDVGKNELGLKNTKAMAGSFIAKSLFDEWHRQHPDWRIIEKGELTGADLIEVPEVTVGNLTAGPVWFAKRPDEAWSKGMIGSMDRVVKGAIGGSFLKYFKVTIDYNSELVKFEK